MTRKYADYPPTTVAEVRDAFAYDPVHGRLLRKMSTGLKLCGTGKLNVRKSVYIMWKRVFWPMELLIWIHGHGKWPTHRIIRLQGYKTHLNNLMEKEPRTIDSQYAAYTVPRERAPTLPDGVNPAALFDFTRIFSQNQPPLDPIEEDDNA